jgi:hypothetical protein
MKKVMGRRILKEKGSLDLGPLCLHHAQRCVFFLAAVIGLFFSSLSFADDGPVIEHQEMETAPAGETILIRAEITDSDGVFDPVLLYRVKGQSSFRRKEMKQVGETTYEAKIPGAFVTGPIEYFLEAFDENGNGPARFGDEGFPIEISIPESGAPPASAGDENAEAWELDTDETDESLGDPEGQDGFGESDRQGVDGASGGDESNAAIGAGRKPKGSADESESTPVGLYAGIGVGVGAVVLVVAVAAVSAMVAGVWLFWPTTTEEPSDEVKIIVGAPVPVNALTAGGRQ